MTKKLFAPLVAAIAIALSISIPSAEAFRPQPAVNTAENAAVITPSDGANLSQQTLAIYVGGAGDVRVDLVGTGTGITFKAVPVGTVLPIQAVKVYATGTSATNLVAIY